MTTIATSLLLASVLWGEIEPPILERFVEAAYPPAMLEAKQSATLVLSLEIDAEGRVSAARIEESAGPAFDAAATQAALQFRFLPARLDGQPVAVRILYRYAFRYQESAPEPVENLRGVVLERTEKVPLPGLDVELFIDSSSVARSRTVTDALGAFSFVDVSTGTHTLRVSGPEVVPVTTEQELRAATRVDLEIEVERQRADADLELEFALDEEELVRAPRIRKRAVETRIEGSVAKMIPGTQGDTLKVVQNLPGVARQSAGSGALVVWGAAPGDTRAYVDGVLVPRIFHTGGVRSTLGADFVASLDLVPGGFAPDYGRALGGLLRVETADADRPGFHARLSADVLDLAGAASAHLTETLRWTGGGRYSWLDRTFGALDETAAQSLVPIPVYWDHQQKLSYTPRENEHLDLLVFGSHDEVERGRDSGDPSAVRRELSRVSYHRAALRWRRLHEDGSSTEVLPWVGYERSERAERFGFTPAAIEQDILRGALRASERRKLSDRYTLRGGVDLELAHTDLFRSGALAVPAREGDVSAFGSPPDNRVNSDRWSIRTAGAALYGAVEIELGAVLVEPGFRVDLTAIDGDRVTPQTGREPQIGFSILSVDFDPRLQLLWDVSSTLTLKAAGGLYHQPPDPADLSSVFGNPRLEVASAVHALAAAAWTPIDGATIELTAFFTRSTSRTARSALEPPPVARALVDTGEGRTLGAQALLRYALDRRMLGWISYSLIRAERRDSPESGWRIFDHDQTHVLSALATWSIGLGFEVGARFRFASGFPRTPVVGAFFNSREDQFEPIFGPQNSTRLPSFVQLDLRASWAWEGDPFSVSVFLDVQNTTNRENAEELLYSHDYSRSAFVSGLPLLPVLGVEGSF